MPPFRALRQCRHASDSGRAPCRRPRIAGRLIAAWTNLSARTFPRCGTLLVLGRGSERCDANVLESRLSSLRCVAGISKLPNDAGVGGRILAANGGTLARGLEAAFAIAFEALIGTPPARRRK